LATAINNRLSLLCKSIFINCGSSKMLIVAYGAAYHTSYAMN